MRTLDRLLVIAVLLWVGSMLLERTAEEFVQPPPPVVDYPIDALPRGAPDADGLPELARGRVSELQVEHPRRGGQRVGTAWQAGSGIWFSARHVVDDCRMRQLGPVARPRIDRQWRHPDADLAAFASVATQQSVPLAPAPPRAGAVGYGVGFPRGQSGVVELTLIGAARMRLTGAVESRRPFRYLLWQIDSLPGHIAHAGDLGGISGGVVLDRSGRAVGVAFSSVPRRALLGMIPYADIVRAADATGAGPTVAAASPADIRLHADALIRQGTVARVICDS